MKTAFLGLGLMGQPMARHLASGPDQLTVWNRSADKAHTLVEFGARLAPSPAMAVEDADAVILMLTNEAAVSDVLLDSGMLETLQPGTIVVDMSSIPPATASYNASVLAGIGVEHLDAPVSGGTKGASAASLAIMVGGKRSAFDTVYPLLSQLGRPRLVGPAGAGQAAKLANQVMVALGIAAVAEGLAFAERLGADPAAVRDALRGGFAESRILDEHGERMVHGDFRGGGLNRIFLKDLEMVARAAGDNKIALPAFEVVLDLYRRMVGDGCGELDHASLIQAVRDLMPETRSPA